ncbi:MAG: alpha amylase C-terminal domain-containing protein [Terriglobales bacterium]
MNDKAQRDRRDASATAYDWRDAAWMSARAARNALNAPMSIYQVDLASWRRLPEDGNRSLTCRELAPLLADYLQRMNFTHVEFAWDRLPSAGPTAALETLDTKHETRDTLYIIDTVHQRGIGVVLDFPPSHLHDSEDALSLFDNFHADAVRISSLESLLYLEAGHTNEHGGRENLESLAQLRRFNEEVYKKHPDVQTITEESTAWPMVSRPTYAGGLGFGLKWDVGWAHDTLDYFRKDPIHRRFHHGLLSFRGLYMFNENYLLPLAQREAAKTSLYDQMPGDDWRKFANLRLLFGYQYSQPGKKLMFMGDEFGQRAPWNPEQSLDWHLASEPLHAGLQRWVEDLNNFYRSHPALHADDFSPAGFEWIDANDAENSVLSYLRRGTAPSSANTGRKDGATDELVVVCNFTPEPRYNYRIGVPHGGYWRELMNSDATLYAGSGQGNLGGVDAAPVPSHGRPSSLVLTLPPLGIVILG